MMKRWIIAAALAATAAGAYAWCGDGAGYGPRGHWTFGGCFENIGKTSAVFAFHPHKTVGNERAVIGCTHRRLCGTRKLRVRRRGFSKKLGFEAAP